MSYEDGWAAIRLEMPDRVPRTEYSIEGHWEVITAVTGIEVGVDSPPEVKAKAQHALRRAWNFDLRWSTGISRGIFGEVHTSMGHAEYAAGGVDRNDNIYCPFTEPEEVLRFDPWETFGERDKGQITAFFNRHYQRQCETDPDCVNMTGIYVTCVSGLIDLFGWDMLLLSCGVDQQAFGEMTNRYASWIQQYFNALAESEAPVVMSHDDMVWTQGAIFSPDWYGQYVFPNYERLWAPLRDAGKVILFTSDGNYTEFIDDIAVCGANGFVLEPMTDMELMAQKYGQTHVIVGNADTRILLNGDRESIRAEVERCMRIGKPCPGFFMAVGNHIPPNTPVENALYYNQVYEELCHRS